ncbi:uncharacterized protein LOC119399335 isoform X1 [Rhipicephalus sanguineus]|uniref:uncharacterized protein LOC119399335 isoform X1 n=1 Tax=Rhipicephalus sanguineus TaxID=34632 RepID=UPI00189433DD|nr:uncharacterized protein LOC119399335 isoform X1 [Rhipicephalus sanguineus]
MALKAAAKSSRKRKFTGRYCCVVGCHNVERRDAPTFYRFPGKWYERERRRAWTEAVRRVNPDGTPWEPRENTRICSEHFVGKRKSDIIHHPAYIPTIFPPVYNREVHKPEQTERLDPHPDEWQHPVGCCKVTPIGQGTCAHGSGCHRKRCMSHKLFTITCKFRKHAGVPSPSNSLGRRSPKCAVTIATRVPPLALADAACQTYCSPEGTLTILLSATDGTQASTQVNHTVHNDKVASTDNG